MSGVIAAGALVTALALAFAAALAQSRDEDLFVRAEDLRTVLFGSLDAGRSVFASAGAKQTLIGPLDRSGFVATESSGFGLTRERYRGDVNLPVLRLATQAASLAGYQWAWSGLYVAAYAGPEIESEQLTVANRVLRLSRPRLGGRAQIEVWANPTDTTLLTATVVAGSTRGSVWARGSAGWRVLGQIYAGPEVTVYVTDTYRETRWGAHLTGFNLGIVQMRLSGGWMTADHNRHSPYLGLTAWIRI